MRRTLPPSLAMGGRVRDLLADRDELSIRERRRMVTGGWIALVMATQIIQSNTRRPYEFFTIRRTWFCVYYEISAITDSLWRYPANTV